MSIKLQKQNIQPYEFIQSIKGMKGPYNIRTLPDIPAKDYSSRNYAKNWTFRDPDQLKRGIHGGLPWANSSRNGVFLVENNGGHSDESITQVTAQFIDFDHVPEEKQLELLESFGIEPSILTLPSRGLHAYWLIQDGDIAKFREIQERLIQYFGSDPTVKNESRVMRLPGYYHHKAAPKKVEVMYWHPENVYTQDDLIRRLNELGVPQASNTVKNIDKVFVSKKKHIAPVNIVDPELLGLVESHVGTMTTTDGEQYKCLCPMHNDHNPSGVYFAGNERFYCHACQESWALSEIASENKWEDIIKYRKKRHQEARKRDREQYETRLNQALSVAYSLPQYVYGHSRLEPIHIQKTVHDVLNTFVLDMEDRGLYISDAERESAKQVIKVWERIENVNQPIIWPAKPGNGKSTLRNLYVDIKANTDPTFGCILVVERKEDAEEIAKFLNRFDQTAWSYLGWDESWCLARKSEYESDMCQKCEHNSCRVSQNKVERQRNRIVITTHQRFIGLAQKGALGSTLGYWVDTDGKRHERHLLIIDEALPMVDNYTVSRQDLQTLKRDVEKSFNESPSLQDKWFSLYNDVIGFLEDITNTRFVAENDIELEIPPRLTKALKDFSNRNWATLLRFLEHGGIVHAEKDDGFTVTVGNFMDYKWDGLSPFILDATGAKDLRYGPKYLSLPEVADTYPPISLHVCSDFGFGKWYMGRNTDKKVLEAQASVAQTLATKHEKVLVIVRKDYEPDYHRLLAKEVSNNKVQIAHFGDLKGRNDYQDCDAALFLGVLDKGDEYYLATATVGDTDPRSLCLDTQEHNKVHRFVSVELEQRKLNEISLEFVQDIYRTQARRGQPVDVYVFSRDEILMNYVARIIGITEIDLAWKPIEVISLTKAEKNVSKLIEALKQFLASGAPFINKSELKTQLGLDSKDNKVWQRAIKNEYVQAFCREHGICEEGPNSRRLILRERSREADVLKLA